MARRCLSSRTELGEEAACCSKWGEGKAPRGKREGEGGPALGAAHELEGGDVRWGGTNPGAAEVGGRCRTTGEGRERERENDRRARSISEFSMNFLVPKKFNDFEFRNKLVPVLSKPQNVLW
jgi:hypothetical protein